MDDGGFNEEIVKDIIYNEDGSFDIITDKTIYKDCKYNGRGKKIRKQQIKSEIVNKIGE